MTKKKIVIVGSKPNATIPEGDIYYCANSAASFYESSIKKGAQIIIIVAASELIRSRRKSKEKEKWLSEKFDRIVNAKSDEIVLLGNEFFPNAMPKVKKYYNGEIKELKFNEINKILKKLINNRFPVLTVKHIFPLSLNSFKNLYKFLFEKFNMIFKKNKLSSGLFRPSTGILSLAYAIYKHGDSFDYYVSGIGLKERDLYPDGFNNTWTPKKNLNSYHVLADEKVSNLLNKKYKIYFDDISFNCIKK